MHYSKQNPYKCLELGNNKVLKEIKYSIQNLDYDKIQNKPAR